MLNGFEKNGTQLTLHVGGTRDTAHADFAAKGHVNSLMVALVGSILLAVNRTHDGP